jgi:hypothetical protein
MTEDRLGKIVTKCLQSQKDMYMKQAQTWIKEIGPEAVSKKLSIPISLKSKCDLDCLSTILQTYYKTLVRYINYTEDDYSGDECSIKFDGPLEVEIRRLEEELAKKRKLLQ